MMTKDQADVLKQRERILYSKLEILDSDLHVIRELTGSFKSGDYSIFAKVGKRRTCDIELLISEDTVPSPTSPVWINKRFRAYVGIKHLATGEIVWFPIGTFTITEPNQDIAITSENTLSIKGVDFVAFLDGTLGGSLETKVVVNPGDYVNNTLQNIFASFTNFDTNISNCEFKIPYKIEKDPDEDLWSLIEEILELYLHYEGFFDVYGTFVYQKMSDLITDAVVWDFSVPENKLIQSISVDLKWDDVRNRIIVNGKDEDGVWPSYSVAALSTNPSWEDCPYTVDKLGETKAFDYVPSDELVTAAWEKIQAETDTESKLYEIKTIATQNGWDAETTVNNTLGEDIRSYLVGTILAADLKVKFDDYKLTDKFDGFINDMSLSDYRYNPRALTINESDYYKVEQCVTRAQYELDTRLSGAEEVKLTTVPIYGLDVNQLIYLDETVNNSPVKGKYCIDEISCKLGPDGTMKITAHKVTKSRFAFDQELLHEKDPDEWQYDEEVEEDASGTVVIGGAETQTLSRATTSEYTPSPTVINNILDPMLVRQYKLTLAEQKDIRDLLKITKGSTHRIRIIGKPLDMKLMLGDSELFRDENGNWYTETRALGQSLIYNAGWTPGSPSLSSYWSSVSLNIKIYPQVITQLDTFLPSQIIKDYSLTETEAKEIAWVGACYGKRTSVAGNFDRSNTEQYIEARLTNSGGVLKISESKGNYATLHRDENKNWYSDNLAYGQSLFEDKGWVGTASELPTYEFDEETNGLLRLDYTNTMAGRNDLLA